jgi:branched-chain amino acid transport system ATP-binding protein
MALSSEKPILVLDEIKLFFGGIRALEGVSLTVNEGDIFAIIGPNGSGKTSLFNCINGVYKPQEGHIFFKGNDISHLASHRRASLGLGRTFQHVELFRGMTVLDNIKLGVHIMIRSNIFGSLLGSGKSKREELRFRQEIEEKIIDFLDLSAIRRQLVGLLPLGFQKRVDLGRALAMQPEVLLLDEPMSGMSAEEKEDMASFLMDVHRDLGITIVWIEHDLKTVMDLSNRVCMLNFGRKIAEGTFAEIQSNQQVVEAYLGVTENP